MKALLVLALALVSARASAYELSDLFDQFGHATQFADQFAEAHGLPKLVKGSVFTMTSRQEFERKAGCATVAFLITAEGRADKFVILDAQPKGLVDTLMLDSLRTWQFDSKQAQGWKALTWNYGWNAPTGSHVATWRMGCAQPAIKVVAKSLPVDAVETFVPYYPPALVEAGRQGCATIAFTVTADGLADDYDVVDIVPDKEESFVKASLMALNRWHFASPAKGAVAHGYVVFAFDLKGADAPARDCQAPSTASSPAVKS